MSQEVFFFGPFWLEMSKRRRDERYHDLDATSSSDDESDVHADVQATAVATPPPPPKTRMKVTIPQGVKGGQPLQVNTPAGLMQVTVPQNLLPGQTFDIMVPQAQPQLVHDKKAAASHDDDAHKDAPHTCPASSTAESQLKWAPPPLAEPRAEASMLHVQLCALDAIIRPSPDVVRQRLAAFMRVRAAILHKYPRAQLSVLGSAATSLALLDSDLDLTLQLSSEDFTLGAAKRRHFPPEFKPLRSVAEAVRPIATGGLVDVIDAAVPIVKFEDGKTRIQIDISFNSADADEHVKWARKQLEARPSLRPVVLALKLLLRREKLNETYTGGVGSYLLLVLCANAAKAQLANRPATDIGALLLLTLDYISNHERGEYRGGRRSGPLILDPMASSAAPPRDIGGKAFGFSEVADVCQTVACVLRKKERLSIMLDVSGSRHGAVSAQLDAIATGWEVRSLPRKPCPPRKR